MTTTRVGVWGGDRGRPKLALARALLGSDPDVVYVLGERDGGVMLEVWDADTGIRVNTVAIARLGQLRADRVWRADRADQVVVAVRGLDRNELCLLDLRTGSLWEEQQIHYREHVMASSRDAKTRAVFDRKEPRYAGLEAPGGSLRPEMRDGVNTYALSGDGVLVACWNSHTQRVLVFESPPSTALVASTDAKYPFVAPHMVFSDERTTLWCASAGEVLCFGLPSMTELGRWSGASRDAEIVAVSSDGRAVLLDGPMAFEVGRAAPVRPGDFTWSPHLARLSPDGARLAYASGTLGWYDLRRDRHVDLHTSGHAGAVLAIAVSVDGRRVATASRDRTIRVCDAETGECVWALEGDAEGFSALCFSPDGVSLYAVTHGHDPRLTAWNLEEGVEVTPSRCLVETPIRMEVSPDGTTLRIAHAHGERTTLVDAASFELRGVEVFDEKTRPSDFPRFDARAGFTPDRGWFVDFGDVLRPEGPRVVVSYFHGDTMRDRANTRTTMRPPLSAVALGRNVVVIAGEQGEVQCLTRVTELSTVAYELRTTVTALAVSPDDRWLYVGTENGQVRVYAL